MATRVTTELAESLVQYATTGRVTTEIAESLVQYAATGRVTTEIAEALVTFPPPVSPTMGQTFTGKLFLGSTAANSSIESGTLLPGGGNPGDLFLLDTAGVGSLHIYDGTSWVQAKTGGGSAGAVNEIQFSDGAGGFNASAALTFDGNIVTVATGGASVNIGLGAVEQAAAGTLTLGLNGGGETTKILGDTISINNAFTIPVTDGAAGEVLTTDGAGAATWQAVPAASPGGASGDIQYNNGGAFGGLSLSDGQLLIGSAGLAPVAATISGGGGIDVTSAAGAITLGSTAGGDLSGSVGSATVVGLQTTPVAVTAPLNGQVLKYNGAAWAPAADAAGIGGSIAVNQVAYGSGANTIQGNASFTYDGTTLSTLNGNAVTAALTAQGNVEFLNTSGNQVVEFENDLFSFNVKTDASVPTGYVTVVEAGQVTITEYSDPTFTTLQAAVNLYGPELDFTIDNALYTQAVIKVVDTGATVRPLEIIASTLTLTVTGLSVASAYSLPVIDGTNGYVLTTDGAGVVSWAAIPAAGITDLTGDVTATGPGSAAATLATSGINTANNLGLFVLAGSTAPTATEAQNNPAFDVQVTGSFTLPTGAPLVNGRQITFIYSDNTGTVTITGANGVTRTMSPRGGSTWVYSTAAAAGWHCTSNV